VNVSPPSGLGEFARIILGSAAAQPQQAAGEEVADLAPMGGELMVQGAGR
jgi:hypothetical protein